MMDFITCYLVQFIPDHVDPALCGDFVWHQGSFDIQQPQTESYHHLQAAADHGFVSLTSASRRKSPEWERLCSNSIDLRREANLPEIVQAGPGVLLPGRITA